MKHITQAMLNVMKAVQSVEKNKVVGTGTNSYKGVEDKDVKVAIRTAMIENELIIVPVSIEPKMQIERWEEVYNGQSKTKQSILTEVKTKYRIIHSSGESLDIEGYGHGQDSQDKSAGKATTYALKYALLYTFLVPTGDIDDADTVHSSAIPTPRQNDSQPRIPTPFDKPWLNKTDAKWKEACEWLAAKAEKGEGEEALKAITERLEITYKLNQVMKAALLAISKGGVKA
jgi:hypothetical protein